MLAAGGDTEEQPEACRNCHHVGRGDLKSWWCKLELVCFVCEFAFINKHLIGGHAVPQLVQLAAGSALRTLGCAAQGYWLQKQQQQTGTATVVAGG